jgi:RNA polymerase sigma factor (sigma-70 family)
MSEPTVFVVDDDEAMRNSLRWLIESVGLKTETHDSAASFLEAYYPGRTGCVILDVRMPGLSGLELQDKLSFQDANIPIIVLTGHGDVPMAVRAMKSGAVDFLEKPCNDQLLLDCIQHALDQDAEQKADMSLKTDIKSHMAQLTPREHDVLEMVVEGTPNKEIAAALGVSTRTVEVHRAKVMEKMQANSLADLVRMSMVIGLVHEEAEAEG